MLFRMNSQVVSRVNEKLKIGMVEFRSSRLWQGAHTIEKNSLTLYFETQIEIWLKTALTILTPSFRHVNASHWETFAGLFKSA